VNTVDDGFFAMVEGFKGVEMIFLPAQSLDSDSILVDHSDNRSAKTFRP
jgi:hypothetical protein